MALRLGMMLITFRNSKERGFDPHPCQHVFACWSRLSFFAIAFSRVTSHLGGGGKGNSWLGRGLPEAHLRVFTLLLILLEHGEASSTLVK